MQRIVVTGANRGIGFALTKQYAASENSEIHACCRNPVKAKALQTLSSECRAHLVIHPLDVKDETTIRHLALELEALPIDLLINNAGIFGPKQQSAFDMDYVGWAETFAVNSMGPLQVAQHLMPSLRLSKEAKVVTISSQMGSLSRSSTGAYAYRSSKAAVNKVMQVLAEELRNEEIIVTLIHPGWVRTEMGGNNADISVDESANGICRVIRHLTMEQSGRFLQWDGSEHPW